MTCSRFARLLVAVSLGCLGVAQAHAESQASTAGPVLFETRSVEEYRFNLGGFSGHFTDWERKGLGRFDGLAANIWVDEIYGNEGDRWASIFRISFWEPGSTTNQPQWSFLLTGDKKTRRIIPNYLIDEGENFRLDTDFALKESIALVLLVNPNGGFLASLNGRVYELPGDLKVGRVQVLVSGMDARIDPFTFEQRVESVAADKEK